jgi:uncharacterized protein (DUF433 family)
MKLMPELPANPHVEIRDGGYYVSGTRIGLDIVVQEFQEGKSPESILRSYPSIGSLAKVYGAITFILEYPDVVETYLRDQDRLWEQLQRQHPLPPDMLEVSTVRGRSRGILEDSFSSGRQP